MDIRLNDSSPRTPSRSSGKVSFPRPRFITISQRVAVLTRTSFIGSVISALARSDKCGESSRHQTSTREQKAHSMPFPILEFLLAHRVEIGRDPNPSL